MPVAITLQGATELAGALSDRQQIRLTKVKTLLEAVQLLEDEAKARVPHRSGKSRLRSRIKGKVDPSGNSGRVVSWAPHSHLIEYGTKPHPITVGARRMRRGQWRTYAKKAKRALTLPMGLRASAQHPGAQEHPFMHPALEENQDQIDRLLQKHGEDLVIRIANTKARR